MTHRHAQIDAVLIAGPTASGKSALALELARRLGGPIVNADASQVYADLRVLTARPGADEEAQAPHALYGHVDAAEPYGVGRWLAEVAAAVPNLSSRTKEDYPQACPPEAIGGRTGPIPIFVGGTGLYFDCLMTGLATVPAIPEEVRAKWRAFGPAPALHAELSRRDPVMAARLRPTDPQRLMRALEVVDATGRSLADWQADRTEGLLAPERCLRLVLAPDRVALDERIARRLDVMVASGAIEEVVRLADRGLNPELPAMKALGVRPLAAYVRGELARAEALERMRLDTRRYAKRQMTWFRNRMADWLHVTPEDALALAMDEIADRRRLPLPLAGEGKGEGVSGEGQTG